MFVQYHTLTSYHAALLNRDDAGLAKRIPFGNAERTRISSQCLKRHWRMNLKETTSLPFGIRSRRFFDREVLRRVVADGVSEETARVLTGKLLSRVMQSKETRQEDEGLALKQPVLFGKPEADYFVQLILECAQTGDDPAAILDAQMKEHQKNFRAVLRAAGGDDLMAGVEGALFGRFVTSDILARTDASVHVAHSFTVHALDNEVDYFTVVDDLKDPGDDAGAAHANDMELGAGLFYGYVVVDVPLLVSNLCGCDLSEWREQPEALADAHDILCGLFSAVATVTPGAKLGSTAPYARAEYALWEVGRSQPRSLANAYLDALPMRGDVMQSAVSRLGDHVSKLDEMYEAQDRRFVSTTRDARGTPNAGFAPFKENCRLAIEAALGAS